MKEMGFYMSPSFLLSSSPPPLSLFPAALFYSILYPANSVSLAALGYPLSLLNLERLQGVPVVSSILSCDLETLQTVFGGCPRLLSLTPLSQVPLIFVAHYFMSEKKSI